jgi:hypothetical protein
MSCNLKIAFQVQNVLFETRKKQNEILLGQHFNL